MKWDDLGVPLVLNGMDKNNYGSACCSMHLAIALYRILGSISTRTSIRRVCIFCRSSGLGTSIHWVLYNET